MEDMAVRDMTTTCQTLEWTRKTRWRRNEKRTSHVTIKWWRPINYNTIQYYIQAFTSETSCNLHKAAREDHEPLPDFSRVVLHNPTYMKTNFFDCVSSLDIYNLPCCVEYNSLMLTSIRHSDFGLYLVLIWPFSAHIWIRLRGTLLACITFKDGAVSCYLEWCAWGTLIGQNIWSISSVN